MPRNDEETIKRLDNISLFAKWMVDNLELKPDSATVEPQPSPGSREIPEQNPSNRYTRIDEKQEPGKEQITSDRRTERQDAPPERSPSDRLHKERDTTTERNPSDGHDKKRKPVLEQNLSDRHHKERDTTPERYPSDHIDEKQEPGKEQNISDRRTERQDATPERIHSNSSHERRDTVYRRGHFEHRHVNQDPVSRRNHLNYRHNSPWPRISMSKRGQHPNDRTQPAQSTKFLTRSHMHHHVMQSSRLATPTNSHQINKERIRARILRTPRDTPPDWRPSLLMQGVATLHTAHVWNYCSRSFESQDDGFNLSDESLSHMCAPSEKLELHHHEREEVVLKPLPGIAALR
ncbi:uncharacterized protein TRIVIDRAFT_62894 [Trichoderma virens Gv29-8]|uniref:Uncharacterized protein n=1 Tax=Hypocrea virens (strain Gv29-8 / FGSC 10586) TaxID=413071 RepID=G9MFF2_HYPVG|nr:uncharacterized protein TRIVIDRAFT_62894 [Trichoderma virens Gv29-8]EHK27118.1 hypothetical protein TRIVIDRAFT_62894 [Trichoderma virens Gv29-8]UKZ57571.1 hypothetical protein TrVGV298_011430 [Trichoderma virens]